jgi:hypothetical protein
VDCGLPTSVSQVAGITGMHHCVWLKEERGFSFLFFSVLGFELRVITLSHSTIPFCVRYFQDRVSQIICPGWLRSTTLLE